jgi:hypothetical protein
MLHWSTDFSDFFPARVMHFAAQSHVDASFGNPLIHTQAHKKKSRKSMPKYVLIRSESVEKRAKNLVNRTFDR